MPEVVPRKKAAPVSVPTPPMMKLALGSEEAKATYILFLQPLLQHYRAPGEDEDEYTHEDFIFDLFDIPERPIFIRRVHGDRHGHGIYMPGVFLDPCLRPAKETGEQHRHLPYKHPIWIRREILDRGRGHRPYFMISFDSPSDGSEVTFSVPLKEFMTIKPRLKRIQLYRFEDGPLDDLQLDRRRKKMVSYRN